MSEQPIPPVTELLIRWRSGDASALEQLLPLVYAELKVLARRHLRHEVPGHSLQSAALVHEAYLRLVDQPPFASRDRAHFLMITARLMRQILIDHARSTGAEKRGGNRKVYLDSGVAFPRESRLDVVALHDALNTLSAIDPRQGNIVELRFFGGLTIEEIAEALEISPASVKRDWRVAKAWLARELQRDCADGSESASVGQN